VWTDRNKSNRLTGVLRALTIGTRSNHRQSRIHSMFTLSYFGVYLSFSGCILFLCWYFFCCQDKNLPPGVPLLEDQEELRLTNITSLTGKGARQNYLCKFILTFLITCGYFQICFHRAPFWMLKAVYIISLSQARKFMLSLTLIYVTRWYSEGRPRKIRI
jgi:hypothetical protein